MEHDEVSSLWKKYDARLDELVRTNAILLQRSSLAGAQTTLARLGWRLRFELALDVLAVVLLGAFAAAHVREVPSMVATVALDVCAIALLATTIAQLAAVGRIDYDGPVLAIAQAVERLRLFRARKGLWILALSPLLWVPFMLVGVRGLLGADPIAALGLPYIAANAVFGLAVLAAAFWIAQRYRGNARPAWLRYVDETLSGTEVRAAAKDLAALNRYEIDESTAA